MKLSKQPTDHIIIKADTGDDYISLNAAVTRFNKNVLNQCRETYRFLKNMNEKYNNTYKLSFWRDVTFLDIDVDDEDVPEEIIDFLEQEEGWSFIEITDAEIEHHALQKDISAEQLCIDIYNTINYKAYEDYTGAELYTSDIDLSELEEVYDLIPETVNP